MYIFTSGKIQEHPQLRAKLKPVFRKIFTVKELGIKKNDPEAYKKISEEMSLQPNEILFIDDKEENINAADHAGLQTVQFSTDQEFYAKFKSLLK